jgi:hypothetical protein
VEVPVVDFLAVALRRERKRNYHKEYVRNRLKSDPVFRATLNSRGRDWKRKNRVSNIEGVRKAQREYTKKRYRDDPRFREKVLKRQRDKRTLYVHNITKEQYDSLLAAQHGACAICKQPFSKTPHIDHDHGCCSGKRTCGRCVRGLLCSTCNPAIALLKDSPALLREAATYLERYKQHGKDQHRG